MMEKSRRAKRMERHHKQRKQPALNMVSLMDIFTILVFFLLKEELKKAFLVPYLLLSYY